MTRRCYVQLAREARQRFVVELLVDCKRTYLPSLYIFKAFRDKLLQ